MPISIEWGTRIISVPQSYLTLISGTLYELDTDQFRLDLKDLEDDVEGMPFPDTHNHNTEVSVAGITYARVIEIINGYSITFEDGQYTVRLSGSNNNFFDVENGILNQNQVQIISTNSAGLQTVETGVSGLTPSESVWLSEIWKIMGLDANETPSLEVTPTGQIVGDGSSITMTITKVGDTVTVQRST